jgi:hypothetical protein
MREMNVSRAMLAAPCVVTKYRPPMVKRLALKENSQVCFFF